MVPAERRQIIGGAPTNYRRRADKLSAAARRSTKIGGSAHKMSATGGGRGRRTALPGGIVLGDNVRDIVPKILSRSLFGWMLLAITHEYVDKQTSFESFN